MFLGEFQHVLDPKGRVILPAAFRDGLAEGLVMTVGLDHCLTVHALDGWETVVAGLRQLQTTDPRQRMFARAMTSSAHPDTVDRQGRVTIPARLRDYATLTKDITVVGADDRLELWDSARWETYRAKAMEDFAATDTPFDRGGI